MRALRTAREPRHDIEEMHTLTRKLLFSMLAAILGFALFSMAAMSQIQSSSSSSSPAPDEKPEIHYRYSVSAGYSYTSLNQLNQARSGLQGIEASVMRDFTTHFGVIADGGYYKYALKSGNPGSPVVDFVGFGPVVHAELYGPVSGFIRGLLGGEHTASNGTIPKVSFAGGFGGGFEYKLSPRFSLRASGDDILSSFVEDPDHLGYSTHSAPTPAPPSAPSIIFDSRGEAAPRAQSTRLVDALSRCELRSQPSER